MRSCTDVLQAYLDTRCGLGEGPFYNEKRNELRFVDIVDEKLYIVDLAKGPSSLKTINTGMSIGVTADIQDEDEIILAGAKNGITRFNTKTSQHQHVAKFWNEKDGPDKEKKYVALHVLMRALC